MNKTKTLKEDQSFVIFQNKILEMMLQDHPLQKILDNIIVGLENRTENTLGSILLLDESEKHLTHGAAPNLPQSYTEAIDGLAIGPEAGSCGTAAYLKQMVICEDISKDPKWVDFKVALSYGLQSAWSNPILNSDGKVLGTLAFYSTEPRKPSSLELEILKVSHLAGIAIEMHHNKKQLIAYQNDLETLVDIRNKELKIVQQDLQTAQEIAHCGSWTYNVIKNELSWSEETYRIFGVNPKTYKPSLENFMKAVHPEDVDFVTNAYHEAISNKKTYDIEHRIIRPDRSQRIVRETSKDYFNDAGEPIKSIGVVLDITEQKAFEENIEKTHKQLAHADKLASLGKLVASVAHEFNNPLFGVTGILEQLGDDLPSEERKHLSSIGSKECWRMADMIKRLQSFYKPSEELKVTTKMSNLANDVLLLIGKDINKKGIVVNCDFPIEEPSVNIVEDQIKQVMINLLQNASDACKLKAGEIEIKLASKNKKMILEVKDNGEGILDKNIDKVFDPFFTTKGVKGTGLGLSVSYGILKDHEGDISVKSTVGKGCTFTITLPISKNI